jgi:hypothetical protein
MRGLIASLAVAATLTAAAPAAADPLAEARAAYTSGAELAKQGRWVEARAEFRRSAALKPHPLTSYNLGYCELMLQSFVRARRLFREALRADGGQLSDEYRASAKEHLATAEARIARVPVTLPDADVLLLVDDRPLEFETGGPPPILVAGTRDVGPAEHVLAARVEVLIDPGPHRFVTRREGTDEEVARTISFDEGPAAELALDAPPPPEPIASEGSGWRPGYIGATVAGGLGVGFVIAGGVLGGVAASSWSDAEEACPDHAHCASSEGPALSNEARDQANGATAAFVIGGAALGAGLVLWLVTAATEPSEVEARADGWALRF